MTSYLPRFTLKSLLFAVALIPLAAYGLARATAFVASAVMTIVILSWGGSLVAWLECEGETRSFARGFAILAIVYAVAAFGISPYFFANELLVTTRLLNVAYGLVAVRTPTPPDIGYMYESGISPHIEQFSMVGQSYFCILVGLAGGWFSCWLYRRRQKANQPNKEPSATP